MKPLHTSNPDRNVAIAITLGGLLLGAAGCADQRADLGVTRAPLRAECAPDGLAPDAWLCVDDRTVECAEGGADVDVVYVGGDGACDPNLEVSDPGPFGGGVHDIDVFDSTGAPVCSTTLTVVDTEAPTIEEHELELWAPNHKLHDISVSDCVTIVDSCDGELEGEFIWGSSDEPINDLGDGNHAPDLLFDGCDHVRVRAERQGPKDGRVYRLGVRAVDNSGNEVEGSCTIRVHHDRRGTVASDSGEAYRIELDGSDGLPECDGVTQPPAEPTPGDGDGSPGDGDADPNPGDGDADPTPGDGDADPDPETPLPNPMGDSEGPV